MNSFEAKHAPEALYLRGDLDLLRSGPKVAIVGSRKASPDGLKRARKLARGLVEHGVTIVSGLAEGIDTAAHTAAIEAGGRTIAVIGTPLDRYYPRKNAALQDKIAAEHLLVSQFAPGVETARFHFPMRNRTMALISDASVIIEAGESSGTKSQGWEALRMGRPLFLVRSVVENPSLSWPKKMVDYGAGVLRRTEDLLGSLPFSQATGELAF